MHTTAGQGFLTLADPIMQETAQLHANQLLDTQVHRADTDCASRHWPDAGKLKSRSGTPVYMAPGDAC